METLQLLPCLVAFFFNCLRKKVTNIGRSDIRQWLTVHRKWNDDHEWSFIKRRPTRQVWAQNTKEHQRLFGNWIKATLSRRKNRRTEKKSNQKVKHEKVNLSGRQTEPKRQLKYKAESFRVLQMDLKDTHYCRFKLAVWWP